ncbi:MAG TPA: DUF2844 domain-containing protein [Polyangiaceae bacterium]|jgi:hypothetical protein
MRTKTGELRRVLAATGVVVCCCLGVESEARATLGGDVASVAANEHRLAGVRHVTKLAAGERHEIELPSGIVVHEYVSPGGAVYAVTWRGPRMPDLRELLGPYFAQLSRRDDRPRQGHHRMTMTGSDLEIRSSGHRRSFVGRAWVPSLVPARIHLDAVLD